MSVPWWAGSGSAPQLCGPVNVHWEKYPTGTSAALRTAEQHWWVNGGGDDAIAVNKAQVTATDDAFGNNVPLSTDRADGLALEHAAQAAARNPYPGNPADYGILMGDLAAAGRYLSTGDTSDALTQLYAANAERRGRLVVRLPSRARQPHVLNYVSQVSKHKTGDTCVSKRSSGSVRWWAGSGLPPRPAGRSTSTGRRIRPGRRPRSARRSSTGGSMAAATRLLAVNKDATALYGDFTNENESKGLTDAKALARDAAAAARNPWPGNPSAYATMMSDYSAAAQDALTNNPSALIELQAASTIQTNAGWGADFPAVPANLTN